MSFEFIDTYTLFFINTVVWLLVGLMAGDEIGIRRLEKKLEIVLGAKTKYKIKKHESHDPDVFYRNKFVITKETGAIVGVSKSLSQAIYEAAKYIEEYNDKRP